MHIKITEEFKVCLFVFSPRQGCATDQLIKKLKQQGLNIGIV